MRFTKLYILILYFVLIICSALFIMKGHYNIAILLILGNMLPGYALANSLLEENEN
tara:strand:- start:612 stop:779 length:168 start_codon:yes stop_codon:yes gene_type:complete